MQRTHGNVRNLADLRRSASTFIRRDLERQDRQNEQNLKGVSQRLGELRTP